MQPEYELPLASNAPARLAQLRDQARPPRGPSVNLTAALGAPTILAGREQEAYEIWRGLCARAAEGDAAAGEDMVMLTLLLANELTGADKLAELRALSHEALQAARLPRHKQEQLGRLCRLAVREGDRVAAFAALSAMVVDPPDIESDSELRVSAAAAATLVGTHQYVLAILGARAADIPIDESLQPLAIVLRANAHEQLGQLGAAIQALRELPHFGMYTDLSTTFSVLKLCPKSSTNYDHMGVSVHRNAPAPLGTALPLGVLFLFAGCFVAGAFFLSDERGHPKGGDLIVLWLCIIFMFLLGVPLLLGGISSRRPHHVPAPARHRPARARHSSRRHHQPHRAHPDLQPNSRAHRSERPLPGARAQGDARPRGQLDRRPIRQHPRQPERRHRRHSGRDRAGLSY